MYTDEFESKGFPLRSILLKATLVIIFILLLIWLIPKFVTPKLSCNEKQVDLSPLTSQIFADNLKRMQDAATSYYTNERLPKNIGDSDQMTLSDMIGKKLIVALIDKNNKACDVEKSYVKITKMDDEYLLKVNLKCSDKEDYILVHLGCYDYCESYLCAKKETTVAVKKAVPQKVITYGPKPSGPIPQEPTPETPKPQEPTPETPKPVVGYEYEYSKTTGSKFSEWTKWSNWTKGSCSTVAYGCDDSDPKCLQKLQVYKRKEKIGTYDKEYIVSREDVRQLSSYQQTTCSNYEYITYNTTTYVTTNYYTNVNTISAGSSSMAGWTYAGRNAYAKPPASNINTRYYYSGIADPYCNDECTSLPTYYYDKYTYNGGLGSVSTTSQSTTSQSNTSLKVNCTGTKTTTIPVYKTIIVYDKAVRKEPLYATVCYQSIKTRKLEESGKTTVKWSSYNDQSLLKEGYHYTGNSRVKK